MAAQIRDGLAKELSFQLNPKMQQESTLGRTKGQVFQADETVYAKDLGQKSVWCSPETGRWSKSLYRPESKL